MSIAYIPNLINNHESLKAHPKITQLILISGGVFLLSLLAQIKIQLWFTPVPITGQTFGVAMLALLWGRELSVKTFLSYLLIGFLGAPVFAGAASGIQFGPTMGYLIGMFFSTLVIGRLSDLGFGQNFKSALIASFIGSICTFSFGLLVLSFFTHNKNIFAIGLFPFIPGDIIKNTLAATIASKFHSK